MICRNTGTHSLARTGFHTHRLGAVVKASPLNTKGVSNDSEQFHVSKWHFKAIGGGFFLHYIPLQSLNKASELN